MANEQRQESLLMQVVFWIGGWAVLMAFWVALMGTFRWTTLLIGAGASLIASFFSVALEWMNIARFIPHWRYFWGSRGVAGQILLGSFQVTGALIKHRGNTEGIMGYMPFYPGGDDSESEARRAVAETVPTMSPTSLVIGVDRKMRLVLFHLLGTHSSPPTLKRLGVAE